MIDFYNDKYHSKPPKWVDFLIIILSIFVCVLFIYLFITQW